MRPCRALPLLVVAWLLALSGSAAADPAGPTHYRSSVTAVTPEVDGLEVAVIGGDSYVQVTAPPGTRVEVEGYDDEPFLRIEPDGTVERNEASPSRWLNDARYGALDTEVPPEASAEAPPRWETIATDGTYAWHDHRVHWMSPTDPRQIDTGTDAEQPVQDWQLELTVDGEPVVVAGELVWLPGPSPVLPAGVALLVAAGGVAVALRRAAALRWVILTGALAAGVVGVAATVGWPAGADSEPALLILPGLSVLLVTVAQLVRRRPGIGPALLAAAAGIPLLVWAVLWGRALVTPIVPTTLPDVAARSLIAVVLGVGVSAVVAIGRELLTPRPLPAS